MKAVCLESRGTTDSVIETGIPKWRNRIPSRCTRWTYTEFAGSDSKEAILGSLTFQEFLCPHGSHFTYIAKKRNLH